MSIILNNSNLMFEAIGFDADDTLWHNEVLFQETQRKFNKILKEHSLDGIDQQLLKIEKNNLKVDEQELKNEIQKQVQSMPGQQKQVLEYYQKNPSATASLRGSIYEDKIINLIKQKSKQIKKTISLKEAEEIIKGYSRSKKHSKSSTQKEESKKPKKTVKSTQKKKKIRKK